MAAIAYPMHSRSSRSSVAARDVPVSGAGREHGVRASYGGQPARRAPVDVAYLRLVAPAVGRPAVGPYVEDMPRVRPAAQVHRPARPHRRARLAHMVPALLTLVMLLGVWTGAGILTSSRPSRLIAPAGATAVHGGYLYVVRPGDTVWSIASAMEPGADPRQLVDQLDAELPDGVLRVGATLHLP